jgi:hypothetical protein
MYVIMLHDYFMVYHFCKFSSSESLDLQSRFLQRIVLEFICSQGYNHCLDNSSIVCMTATKCDSFIVSVTCLALANSTNINIFIIAYNGCLLSEWLRNVII